MSVKSVMPKYTAMLNKVMLSTESRMRGDMQVRFGGRYGKTYCRKAVRRSVPSLRMVCRRAHSVGVRRRMRPHDIHISPKGSGFWEQVPVFPFLSGLHPARPAHIKLSFCTLVRQFVLPSVRGSSCWMFFRSSAMLPASYALRIRLPYSVLREVRQVSRPRMAIQT